MTHNFGEKTKEKYKAKEGWMDLEVWQSPKYTASKDKAIELIEKSDYGLDVSDFWILKNKGGQKLVYTGLIISHNGCLKINDKLELEMKFKPNSVAFVKDGVGKDKVMSYINEEQGIYEFGEISPTNCKNDYPYAMVLKRLMDRVILKNSKVGFHGIYSEAESDEFKERPEPKDKSIKEKLADSADEEMKETCQKKNEEDFNGLKSIIENCGGEEELKGVWIDKDNAKILNQLRKYSPDLYELLEVAKDLMKQTFSENVQG